MNLLWGRGQADVITLRPGADSTATGGRAAVVTFETGKKFSLHEFGDGLKCSSYGSVQFLLTAFRVARP